MSLNVKEFDKNFCQQLAVSTEKLADLQREATNRIPPVIVPMEEEKDVSCPDPGPPCEEFNDCSAGNDESHVTYITQNASTLLGHMSALEGDTSRVDYPKFSSLPQLPPLAVLQERSPAVSPPSSCSQTRSLLSGLNLSDSESHETNEVTGLVFTPRETRTSSDFSLTTRTPGSTFSERPEPWHKSPPPVERVVTPDLQLADVTFPKELSQFSQWIGQFRATIKFTHTFLT